jgi:uncharacterized protein YjbI with pentapeptide repeats
MTPGVRVDPPDLPPHLEPAEALTGAGLDGEHVGDVDAGGLRAVGMRLDAARLERVRLTGARLAALDVRDSVLVGCDLANVDADLVAFAGAALTRVRFQSCVLTQADFQGARLKAVVFEDCDLTDADLSGGRFDGAELRGCRLGGLRGANALRGVSMPWSDVLDAAGLFAAACGVKVLADGE